MSHMIGGCLLKARKKETAMKEGLKYAKWFARRNTDPYENPKGTYFNDFRFYNRVFDDEEQAYKFFDELGSYRDGVVMIKGNSKKVKPKYFVKVEVHC